MHKPIKVVEWPSSKSQMSQIHEAHIAHEQLTPFSENDQSEFQGTTARNTRIPSLLSLLSMHQSHPRPLASHSSEQSLSRTLQRAPWRAVHQNKKYYDSRELARSSSIPEFQYNSAQTCPCRITRRRVALREAQHRRSEARTQKLLVHQHITKGRRGETRYSTPRHLLTAAPASIQRKQNVTNPGQALWRPQGVPPHTEEKIGVPNRNTREHPAGAKPQERQGKIVARGAPYAHVPLHSSTNQKPSQTNYQESERTSSLFSHRFTKEEMNDNDQHTAVFGYGNTDPLGTESHHT